MVSQRVFAGPARAGTVDGGTDAFLSRAPQGWGAPCARTSAAALVLLARAPAAWGGGSVRVLTEPARPIVGTEECVAILR